MTGILTGMRRTVYLARHGETAWNRAGRWQGHTDVALNEAGREQARLLAEALRPLGIVQVWSSDLARARETAEIVAAALGLGAVVADPDLRERAFGSFEGLTRDECAARFPDQWARYHADIRLPPPGGEPHDAVRARMRAGVLHAAGALPDGGVGLVVGHGGAMRALVTSITGVIPPPLDNGAMFRLEILADAFGAVDRIR
jgi:broad specificity phosphatase PhoE